MKLFNLTNRSFKFIFIITLFIYHFSSIAQSTGFDTAHTIQQLNNLDVRLNKLNNKHQKLYYSYDRFVKEHNSEVHSQQYKNDSLFEQVFIMNNGIDDLKKEIERLDRNIRFLRETDLVQNKNAKIKYIILFVLLGIIYLISIAFLILNRKKFRKQNAALGKELKTLLKQTEEKSQEIKQDILQKIEEEIKKLEEIDEKNKKDIQHRLNESRESIESRLREINNQLDDRFSK